MFTLAVPPTHEVVVELAERNVLHHVTMEEASTPRVSLGIAHAEPLTLNNGPGRRGLLSRLRGTTSQPERFKKHQAFLLRITCSIRPGRTPLTEAHLSVALGPRGQMEGEPRGEVKAYVAAMHPMKASTPVAHAKVVEITPKLTFSAAGVASTRRHEVEYNQEVNHIVATGVNEGIADWYLHRTKTQDLLGVYSFLLLAVTPKDDETAARMAFSAQAKTTTALFRWRARIPSDEQEIVLPAAEGLTS